MPTAKKIRRYAATKKPPLQPQVPALAIPKTPKMPAGGGDEVSFTLSGYYGTLGTFNPDDLVGKKGLQIYKKMLLDDQVRAAIYAKQFAVLSTGFEIVGPEVSDQSADQEIADELTDFTKFNFEDMQGSFDSKLYEIMTSVPYGFSVTERVLRLVDTGRWAGKIALKGLKTRQPYNFYFYTDDHGNLLPDGVRQNNIPMPAEKFIIHSYHKTFDNFYGESDLRAAYEPWWRKSNANRFKMITLERYGEPLMVFTHTQRLSPDNKTELQTFGKNLQNRSVLILPQFITLDLKQGDPKIAAAFIPVIQEEDAAIRIALLMPGLIGLSGERVTGSFARAVKEFDAFLWVIEELRNDLETLINEQIVKPVIDLNYEVTEGKYPIFRFREITQQQKEALFNLWLAAVKDGAFTKTREDENKGRELIEFPRLPDDVPMTGGAAQPPAFDPVGNPIDTGDGSGYFPTPTMPGKGAEGPGSNFFPFGKDSILSYRKAA